MPKRFTGIVIRFNDDTEQYEVSHADGSISHVWYGVDFEATGANGEDFANGVDENGYPIGTTISWSIPMDRTIDGVEIVIGLRVWDYDLRPAIVAGPQKYRNPNEAQWYEMTNLEGGRSKMMDGGRMWYRHPTTGKRV